MIGDRPVNVQGDFFFVDCPECTAGVARIADCGVSHVMESHEDGWATLRLCPAVEYRPELWPTPPKIGRRFWTFSRVPNDVDLYLKREAA